MRCEKFETRLNQLLDDRREPSFDALLTRHARHCPRCSDVLAGCSELFDGLQHVVTPLPPADLSRRVLAEVGGAPGMGGRWFRVVSPWLAAPWLTTAAATLMAVVGLWSVLHSQPDGKLGGAVQLADRSHIMQGAAGLQTGDLLHTINRPPHLSPEHYQRWLADAEAQAERQLTLASELADGLRPVASSVSAALDALRRTLPGRDDNLRSSWAGDVDPSLA